MLDTDLPLEPASFRTRCFRFFSKHKSFLLQTKTIALQEEWFTAIAQASTAARTRQQPLLAPEVLNELELFPIFQHAQTTCHCCAKEFSLFIRKHHCRNCGVTVCELCSKDKVRIPKLEDTLALYRVCIHCAKVIKESRQYGVMAQS